MTDRTPGAYGRRVPKNHPALQLARLLTGVLPAHPTSQDNLAPLSDWQMLGNDSAGDCVAVTWANFRRLVTAILGAKEVYPTQDQVWAIYKTQNPTFDPNGGEDTGPGSDADQGMDIQTLLEYLVKVGGPDKVQAVAFAKVDHTNLEEVKAALAIFGGVWTGINVQEENQNEFSEGKPWDWTNSPVEGGHSVLSGGYQGAASNDVRFITWAAETGFTDKFWTKGVEEAWVVIWPEHLGTKAFEVGIDLGALAEDFKDLTGATLPVPTPVPNPVPPEPTPTPGSIAWPSAADPWLDAHHTEHKAVAAQTALKTLRSAMQQGA